MALTRRKTEEVLAAARRDLQAQLAVVRSEIARLGAEEDALTGALASLNGASSSPAAATGKADGRPRAPKKSAARRSIRKASSGQRRRPRGPSKPTADRVKELQALLADGAKSRNALAAALKVSPARVQQLLSELGGAVSSQPDPAQRQGKLWSLKSSGNGATAAKPTPKRSTRTPKAASARKPTAEKAAAAK